MPVLAPVTSATFVMTAFYRMDRSGGAGSSSPS
jgi:hypothetical protein